MAIELPASLPTQSLANAMVPIMEQNAINHPATI
jgi:hypothetical protein